ncbi:MAG: serine hydrolase, partial [Myxococcota bacterium]
PLTWPSGGGGLVSTAEDYVRFALMLAQEGQLDGTRVLRAASVRALRSDQLTDDQRPTRGDGGFFFESGYGYGVGVAIEDFPERNARVGVVPGDYGWAGVFDTTFQVSPATGLVGVFLTQVVPGPHLPRRNEGVFVEHLHRVVAE